MDGKQSSISPHNLYSRLGTEAAPIVIDVRRWLDTSPLRSARFRPIFRVFFCILLIDCVVLVFAGARPPEGIWLFLSRVSAAYYFLHFLVVLPLVGLFERPRPLPTSISQPVFKAGVPTEHAVSSASRG